MLRFTDVGTSGHYHIGGAHSLFDTTAYTNGTHVLKMTVYDTVGQSGSREVTVTISNGPGSPGGGGTPGPGGSGGSSSDSKCGLGAAFALLVMVGFGLVGRFRRR